MAFDKDPLGGAIGPLHAPRRFPHRNRDDWVGPLVDYKEIELLRKFLTSSSKQMSRRRAGTDAKEQAAIKQAIKRARFLGLLAYRGQ